MGGGNKQQKTKKAGATSTVALELVITESFSFFFLLAPLTKDGLVLHRGIRGIG
jgi:hypothetical protein